VPGASEAGAALIECRFEEISMRIFVTFGIAIAVFGCSKDETKSAAPAVASSTVVTPPPSALASASAAPSAAPSAEPEPHHDCPANSNGIGSFTKPCDAKGAERIMKVKWTKTDDKGPNFSIKNLGKTTIVYGKIAVYFYDKGRKQLDLMDDSETPPKARPYLTCAGNIFQGVMKPGESATLTFSCVPKKAIPEGTTTIESEMQTVGFADATEKKIDFYWRNMDLTPNQRPMGGIK
jgi:hypothetical protein